MPISNPETPTGPNETRINEALQPTLTLEQQGRRHWAVMMVVLLLVTAALFIQKAERVVSISARQKNL